MAKFESSLDVLPFPLKNAGKLRSADPTEMLRLDLIGEGRSENKSSVIKPRSHFATTRIGAIKLVATRATPCVSAVEDAQHITLAMLYAGDRYEYKNEGRIQAIEPGNIHLCQRMGGIADIGYFSGIICEIDRFRLDRTMRAMGVEEFKWNQQRSYVLQKRQRNQGVDTQRHLWSIISLVDELLGESSYLATGLGLDEQIYRLLVLSLLQEERVLDVAQRKWCCKRTEWANPLDDLVDYIRDNAHLNLTLTDLEERSHYSGRHLQNLFKEKFDCTPMQFVRRQRLSMAMEKLQLASCDDTVTNIAREIGYHYTSNFTQDFQREFGVNPSAVLRGARQLGKRADC